MSECAACGKTAYHTEAIRCLDKTWHKACFRCQTCNKVLGIQNFKGSGGLPYCSMHYPNPKSFTLVNDSPAMQQVAANTRNMSKIQYHKEYENSRGRIISVPEDAMGRGQKAIAQNVSRVNYSQPIGPPTSPVQPQSANQMNYNGQMGSQGGMDNEPQDLDSAPIYRPNLVLVGGMRVTGSGMNFRAVYDYNAAEDDEVSFVEGDEILHGEPIDEGWMFGTVKRTGEFGMLPSNYVVPIPSSKFSS